MTILPSLIIEHLVNIEANIHYIEPPPPERDSFLLIDRDSPILLSAPHGCRTYRNRKGETWHEEDEYTAGMALLLSEMCNTSVIATTWRTDVSDPNDTYEDDSPYKQTIRELKEKGKIHWLIDLHGAALKSSKMAETQLVDLGTGTDIQSMPADVLDTLRQQIENKLELGVTDRNGEEGWTASIEGRSISAFAHQALGLRAVQIEMKPSIRIVQRRIDASMYGKPPSEYGGPYEAPSHQVRGMMQALVDFIEYLKNPEV